MRSSHFNTYKTLLQRRGVSVAHFHVLTRKVLCQSQESKHQGWEKRIAWPHFLGWRVWYEKRKAIRKQPFSFHVEGIGPLTIFSTPLYDMMTFVLEGVVEDEGREDGEDMGTEWEDSSPSVDGRVDDVVEVMVGSVGRSPCLEWLGVVGTSESSEIPVARSISFVSESVIALTNGIWQ